MALTRPRAYQIYDIDYKQATRVVTTTNITLAGGAPNTVDGVTLAANDRVLVTAQSTGSENGIYYVTTLGTGSNGTWARSVDTNSTGELLSGTIVMVTEGTVFKDTQWKLTTDDPITIGSTALTFVQNYSANSISAGTSNVVVTSNSNVTISSAGTANVLTISSTGIVVSGTISGTGNITGNYFIGNGSQLTGINASGGGGTISFSNTAPVSASAGDVWIQANTAVQYVYFSDDTSSQWAEMEAYQSFSGGSGSGSNVSQYIDSFTGDGANVTFQLSIAPENANLVTVNYNGTTLLHESYTIDGANITFGSAPASGYKFDVATLSGGGSSSGTPGGSNTQIQFNSSGSFGASANLTFDNSTNTLATAVISATGNITGNYFIGNGSQLTGISAGASNVSIRAQAMTMSIILGS